MLYWAPGVEDIQQSPHLFSLSLEDNEQLIGRFQQMEGHTGKGLDVGQYIHDDSIDTTDKSVVVDWYYKKAQPGGQTVLHYCKYCNGVVLYASENDPELARRGFYDHGKYPFVFDPLFMEEDSPAGFGYIDVMKDTQTAIDEMNHAMDENVKLAAKQRFVERHGGGERERAGGLFQGHCACGGAAEQRQLYAAADERFERQLHELPGCPGERAEGSERQPGREPGRHHQRPDRCQCHCGAAGGGQQAEPGHAEKRVPGVCEGVLPDH